MAAQLPTLDDVVLLAVLEWDPPIDTNDSVRRLRIRRRDLSEGVVQRIIVCSPRDLWRRLLIASTTNDATADPDSALDQDSVRMEIFDVTTSDYIEINVQDTSCNLLERFGSRLRVRLTSIQSLLNPSDKTNTNATTDIKPLAITGRFYPFDGGITIHGHRLDIAQHPAEQGAGTGVTVWDGAVLMARYLEVCPTATVQGKRVLEMGAGCGIAGLTAACLSASAVLLTDLPYVLPLLQSNIDRNRHIVQHGTTTTAGAEACQSVECCECDWYQQRLNPKIVAYRPQVIIVADCVWIHSLVEPLLRTLQGLLMAQQQLQQESRAPADSNNVHVIFSYQRRGKAAHETFWKGLERLFSSIETVDTAAVGLEKPDVLQVLSCRR